jgi:hypothetical protein
MTGLNLEQAHGCLASAYEAIQKGHTFAPDTYADEVLRGYQVAILEVLDPLGEHPMSMVNHLFGEVHGLQIVWPDRQGKFPWHPDFEEQYRDHQPLLGVWNGP